MGKEIKIVFVIGDDYQDMLEIFIDTTRFLRTKLDDFQLAPELDGMWVDNRKFAIDVGHLEIRFFTPVSRNLLGRRCHEIFGYLPPDERKRLRIFSDTPPYSGPLFSYVLEELGGK